MLLGCQLPGCGGPRSGVCINNLSFEECPDVVELHEDGEAVVAEPIDQVIQAVALPGGRSLDVKACDTLLRQRGGHVVGLVAAPDVGKTTLVATIYELLHRRRMKNLGFAGSETMRGYEERSHLARIVSNAAKPDTKRTPVSTPLTFTHLRIATSDVVREVVFSDRSGEHFDSALARPADFGDFVELRRADVIVMLVDLVRLLQEPHLTRSWLRRVFLALDQCSLLEGRRLMVVGTKADIAMPTRRSKKAILAFAEVVDEIDQRAAGRFTVGSHLVACRARTGSTLIGEGMEQLLTDLLAVAPQKPVPSYDFWPLHPSELDMLMRGYRNARS